MPELADLKHVETISEVLHHGHDDEEDITGKTLDVVAEDFLAGNLIGVLKGNFLKGNGEHEQVVDLVIGGRSLSNEGGGLKGSGRYSLENAQIHPQIWKRSVGHDDESMQVTRWSWSREE